MLYIEVEVNTDVVLQLSTKSKGNELSDQPSGYPKINIFRMDGTTGVEVLASTQMVEHVDGEYQYRWTAPTVKAYYKVRYIAKINNIEFTGYDYVRVLDSEDVYDGAGQ